MAANSTSCRKQPRFSRPALVELVNKTDKDNEMNCDTINIFLSIPCCVPKVCDGVVRTVGSTSSTSRLSTCRPCQCDVEKESRDTPRFFSYLEKIGQFILIPGPLTLVSFILLIFVGLISAFGLAAYRRFYCGKKVCTIKRL